MSDAAAYASVAMIKGICGPEVAGTQRTGLDPESTPGSHHTISFV